MSILSLINAALQKHGWLIARLPSDEEERAAQLVELLVETTPMGAPVAIHCIHGSGTNARSASGLRGKTVASLSRARFTGAETGPGIRLAASFAPNSGGLTSRQKRPTCSQMTFDQRSTSHCFAGLRAPKWRTASCLRANPAIATLTTMSPAI